MRNLLRNKIQQVLDFIEKSPEMIKMFEKVGGKEVSRTSEGGTSGLNELFWAVRVFWWLMNYVHSHG